MKQKMKISQAPVLYLPHGGGPMPLLNDPRHEALTKFLKAIKLKLGLPSAILLVSAHWETEFATITSSAKPELIYDYYGFPEASYHIEYPASGSPQLAKRILQLLKSSQIISRLDENRGFDHGMFVPLKLMFPDANIPCIQLSLMQNLDPLTHINIGKAISEIRKDNILIIGSGLSFHNMQAFFSNSTSDQGAEFDQWLGETMTQSNLTIQERVKRLVSWEKAPNARYSHPREEHLLPLHVCFGAAMGDNPIAETVFHQKFLGNIVSAFLWR